MKTETYEYLSDWARENIAKGEAEGRAKGLAEGLAEGRAEGRAEGEAEGKAQAVLAVLAARGIDVPGDLHDKIKKCRDLGRLDAWIRAAATVQSADALLNDDL